MEASWLTTRGLRLSRKEAAAAAAQAEKSSPLVVNITSVPSGFFHCPEDGSFRPEPPGVAQLEHMPEPPPIEPEPQTLPRPRVVASRIKSSELPARVASLITELNNLSDEELAVRAGFTNADAR